MKRRTVLMWMAGLAMFGFGARGGAVGAGSDLIVHRGWVLRSSDLAANPGGRG